eukprot:s605_g3.t1
MACEPDYMKAVYFFDASGSLRESLPDEQGQYDDETEFWRDSQVSSGWWGAAYRAYSDLRPPTRVLAKEVVYVHDSLHPDDKKDGTEDHGVAGKTDDIPGTAEAFSDAPEAQSSLRSRLRSRSHKRKQQQ